LSDPLALGERVLALLEQSARTSTYKPALLLALIDRAPEHVDEGAVPVSALAERVIELYWPQTLEYPTTGQVLVQSQAGGQALIVRRIVEFRGESRGRSLPESWRRSIDWTRLVETVELALAEWPIPRLQRPLGDFLYTFDWPWEGAGGWSARAYRSGARAIRLAPGVGEALISLGPLLRPFITRWWSDKAARLNPSVESARSVVEFEEFLFGRDRVSLGRVGADLLALHKRRQCFYCHRSVSTSVEVDHFIPWTFSGDDGIDNLVAACRACNNEKRATLPGPRHLADLIKRHRLQGAQLQEIADKRSWPRHSQRSALVARAAYARTPDGALVWSRTRSTASFEELVCYRAKLAELTSELVADEQPWT
jgi:hypothetical protein